jgi:predicted secreted protein
VDDVACEHAAEADLPVLLDRLRAHLWQRWPQRLQVRVAAMAAGTDDPQDGLVQRLTAALEAQARAGTVRADVAADALARVVLALLTGDVVQRFVAREAELAADPAFLAEVVRLVSVC